MKMKLKICGMRDPQNIVEVAALRPEFMGFIFYKESKRFVGNSFSIPNPFPSSIKKVGVFVDEQNEVILKLVHDHTLDYVQLHGHESTKQCEALKKNKVGVIKSFLVDENFDFEETISFQPHVDFFLFDTKTKEHGGSGKSFDWNLLEQYDQRVPFFLSGGLSPENIGSIVKLKGMNLYALDVNSRVEDSPAKKNSDKIKTVIEILNSISNEL